MQRNLAICAGLSVAVAAVYGQAYHFEFLALDDGLHVTLNPVVQAGLTWEGVRWAFTEMHAFYWIPLTWLSHMLDCELFGLDPAGPHMTNLLLHGLNTLLLFGLLQRTTKAVWPSAFAAALFALHPLRVESVAWITERKDVLSTFFGLLSMWLYASHAKRGGVARYAGMALLFTASLMAKPMLVTLPFLLLLVDYWPLQRTGDRRTNLRLLVEKLPLLAIAAGLSAMTLRAHSFEVPLSVVPLPSRIANGLVSCVRYLGKTVWPVDLIVMYPHPNLPGGIPWTGWQVAGAAVLLLLLSALALRRRYATVGWLWYLGTLLPVLGLVQVGFQAMADRFTYFPLIGLFIIVAWGGAELFAALRARLHPALPWAVALGSLVALGGVSAAQARHWRDSLALYQHALEVVPDNPMVHIWLGMVLQEEGKSDAAITHFREALRAGDAVGWGGFHEAHYNLGVLLNDAGNTGEAIPHLRFVARTLPNFAEGRGELGRALRAEGRAAAALPHYERAARLSRHTGEYLDGLAWALLHHPDPKTRDPERAVKVARRAAIATDYEDPAILETMAAAFAAKEDWVRAAQAAQAALHLRPEDPLADRLRRNLDRYRGEIRRGTPPVESG